MTNSEIITQGEHSSVEFRGRSRIGRLVMYGILSELCYLAISISARSLHESEAHSHDLLVLLALFGGAFGLYLVSLRTATAIQNQWLLPIMWTGAIVFRLTLLLSDPIEEIDLYRYLWDGAASKAGVNPFQYAPQQVLASSADESLPDDLRILVLLRDTSPELTAVLRRVHFGELPTIYPPIGQVVFAACSWLTPSGSSVAMRLTLMKAWFVVFDLATFSLVLRLLRLTNRHPGWAVAYGWCPLVVKEIANSGHLDSLAMFFATLALTWVFLAIRTKNEPHRSQWYVIGASVALGLGVGAKLYPLVLAPLMLWTFSRQIGWKSATLACVVFGTVSFVVLWPMKPNGVREHHPFDEATVAPQADDAPPLPPSETSTAIHDPSESLQAFLSRWEMNDFLFLVAVENLRPTAGLPPHQVAWFTVTPSSWRESLVTLVRTHFDLPKERIPFLLARVLLSIVFVAIACGLGLWANSTSAGSTRENSSSRLLEAGFLTLAWFWLLLPTQNPWYLLWCLPLLPFARNHAWLALSGLAFIYYLRFWMTSEFRTPIWGTAYPGPQFFDYIVTWIEFAPWLVLLTFGWLKHRNSRTTGSPASSERIGQAFFL